LDGDERLITKDGQQEKVVVSKIFPTTHFEAIRSLLRSLPNVCFKDRNEFEEVLDDVAKKGGMKLAAPVRKAVLSALSERDETAAVCVDSEGNAESDPELRDTESVPLAETVESFFAREVKPHVPDAWIDTDKCDSKDGEVGIVGYEINFNRYFYRYVPPRSLETIEVDIRGIERDVLRMLADVTGTKPEDDVLVVQTGDIGQVCSVRQNLMVAIVMH
jgi:type I restriction enzyme M protein